jgi:hypothetical protein
MRRLQIQTEAIASHFPAICQIVIGTACGFENRKTARRKICGFQNRKSKPHAKNFAVLRAVPITTVKLVHDH